MDGTVIALRVVFVGVLCLLAVRLGRGRERDEGSGRWLLAGALVAFALAALLALDGSTPVVVARALALAAAARLALAWRDGFLPSAPGTQVAATTALGLALLVVIAGSPFPADVQTATWSHHVALTVMAIAWLAVVAVAIVPVVAGLGSQPAVSRARLRSIAIGVGGASVAVVVAAGAARGASGAVGVGAWALGLASTLFLIAGIVAPAWLRAIWRAREEAALRAGLHALLESDDENELFVGACFHAARITGARGASIVRAGATVATWGLSEEAARDLNLIARGADGAVVLDDASGMRTAVASLGDPESHLLAIVGGPHTPPFGDGEAAWLSAFARSIGTALRRIRTTDALAAQTAKLRALDETKDALLTAVSHDIRTPLTAIQGLAETLLEQGAAIPPAERKEILKRVVRNTDRLGRLVTDLLDLDRLRRGVLEPKRAATNVGALVRHAVADAEPPSTHQVHVEVGDVIALVDAAKLERIVENLVMNATRHTPAGTNVWIRVESEPAGVLLIVEDDGPGIPEEDRERIFDVFTRGADAPGGLGVGLPLVARFAESHGGRAWAGIRPGGGASFHVWLPERRPVVHPEHPAAGSRRVEGV